MIRTLVTICLALSLSIASHAQRGGNPDAQGAVDRKMTYTDPTGTYAAEDFQILSDAVRQVEQIILSPALIAQLPFAATYNETDKNGMTRERMALSATVQLAGTDYEMKAFRYARTSIQFAQFRERTVDLRPLNAAFHAAFRADPTIKITITSNQSGESITFYDGTLNGQISSGGRGR